MKASTTTGVLVLASVVATVTALAGEPQRRGTPNTYHFEDDSPGKPPAGFTFARTRNLGKPGRWVVVAQKDAPSAGNALAQLDDDATSARSPLAVTTGVFHSDLRVSVKCKVLSGRTDQSCGVVFRCLDENNYYLTRSNVLERNVRLYHVKKGNLTQLATWEGKVPGNSWNEIAAEAKGNTLRVYFNGQKVIEAKDNTFRAGGRAGLWTQADSVVSFDDFEVTSL
jgi:hypothetical protein